MHRTALACALALPSFASLAFAQERYWVGVVGGTGQVDAAGTPWQTVLPASNRNAAVAPDGKVWLVAAGITVLNADGTPFRTITPSAGISPFAIAFDRAGHAWVSGGNGVEEFDAGGNSQGTVALNAGAPLGIAVDADGNKWIAHRIGPPGSVSRIDAVTRTVTDHPMPPNSAILPIVVLADSRGIAQSSHVWVVGDNRGAGELIELDATGAVLNTHVISATARLQWLTCDIDAGGVTRNVWVGDWGNGDLHRVDVATGTVTTFPQGTGVYGVTFDGFGRLWISLRNTNLNRIDPASGAVEVETAVRASSELSTRWRQVVADQNGDLDGDTVPNLIEVMSGSSPFDGCSTPAAGIAVRGPSSLGSATSLVVTANAGIATGLAFARGSTSPGIGLPGIGCTFQLDLATMFPVAVAVAGPTVLNFNIPNQAQLRGTVLAVQGLNAAAPTFTNVAAWRFF